MSTPEIPSTSAWWVLAITAKRLPDRFCTSQISHSGLCAVQALREQPPGEPLQRGVVGRLRQRGVADVVVGVEVRVVGPHRPALAERDVGEPLAVARHEVQARLDVLDELRVRRRRALEDHHRRDVHVRGRVVLEVQERRVQRGQAVRVGHRMRLSLIRPLRATLADRARTRRPQGGPARTVEAIVISPCQSPLAQAKPLQIGDFVAAATCALCDVAHRRTGVRAPSIAEQLFDSPSRLRG